QLEMIDRAGRQAADQIENRNRRVRGRQAVGSGEAAVISGETVLEVVRRVRSAWINRGVQGGVAAGDVGRRQSQNRGRSGRSRKGDIRADCAASTVGSDGLSMVERARQQT